VLTKGKGKCTRREHRGEVHYTGWTTDGKRFDSSVVRAKPAEFPLAAVIKGWTSGRALMVEGEKTRFWIPARWLTATSPARPGSPSAMLVFDIELIEDQEIVDTPLVPR